MNDQARDDEETASRKLDERKAEQSGGSSFAYPIPCIHATYPRHSYSGDGPISLQSPRVKAV